MGSLWVYQADIVASVNDIAIAYGASRDFYRRTGCNALADRCSKIRGSIHDALEKSGYFNDWYYFPVQTFGLLNAHFLVRLYFTINKCKLQ